MSDLTEDTLITSKAREMLGLSSGGFNYVMAEYGIKPLLVRHVRYWRRTDIEHVLRTRNDQPVPEGWLDIRQVCAMLALSRFQIVTMIDQGAVEARQVRHKWYIPPEEARRLAADPRTEARRRATFKRMKDVQEIHPLDIVAREEWARYGFEVQTGGRPRCTHPLVEAGMGPDAALLCGRCGVVYVGMLEAVGARCRT